VRLQAVDNRYVSSGCIVNCIVEIGILSQTFVDIPSSPGNRYRAEIRMGLSQRERYLFYYQWATGIKAVGPFAEKFDGVGVPRKGLEVYGL
jgi:hypothetical protein